MGKQNKQSFCYFNYFAACADDACRAADLLYGTFTQFTPDRCSEMTERIHQIENEADAKKHEMTEHLVREFLPPIEREDIISLAQELDDVVDAIDDVMRRVYMFRITELRPEALAFAELIAKCCHALARATGEFRSFRKSSTLREDIVSINSLESEGDTLHSKSIRALFDPTVEVSERLVWLTMFECLEACLDACEDASDIMETVMMKNS